MTDKRTFGHYKILKEIGRGGMATVYLAHDHRFDRNVALKILPPQFTHDPDFLKRFDTEARILAALEHHAIVPFYDCGEEEGWPYLAMRYMAGASLKDQLAEGPLPLDRVMMITSRICSALDKAHRNGTIHRDIKPGNILFDEEGLAYLADFGVARLAEMTKTFTMVGTADYMTPEQIRSEALDYRSDIYQMGVVLYEMLSGRLPFTADNTAAVLYMHAHEPVPPIRDFNAALPEGCAAVVERALAKKPADRYDSAGALAITLDRAITAPGSIVRPIDKEERLIRDATPAIMPEEKAVTDEVPTDGEIPGTQAPAETRSNDLIAPLARKQGLAGKIGGREGLIFAGQWTLISLLAWFVNSILSGFSINYLQSRGSFRDSTWILIVVFIAISALVAFGQWLLLRRRLDQVRWWILAGMSGIVSGLYSGILIDNLNIDLYSLNVAVLFFWLLIYGLPVGLFVGAMQWLVLRTKVMAAWWWIVIATAVSSLSAVIELANLSMQVNGTANAILLVSLSLVGVTTESLLKGLGMAWLLARSGKLGPTNVVQDRAA